MFDIGRVCLKIAGRDAKNYCVVVEVIDDNFVLVDGQTRRKRCNVKHLEPTSKTVKVSKGADHKAVVAALNQAGFETKEKTSTKKESKPRPKKQKIVKNQGKEKKTKKSKKADKKENKPAKEDKVETSEQ